MSNKHYRTPVNLPKSVETAIRAEIAKNPDAPPLTEEQSLARIKRYLNQVLELAHGSLESGDGLISVREGLQASRSLLAVIKYEQRLRERAEKGHADAGRNARTAAKLDLAAESAKARAENKQIAELDNQKINAMAAGLDRIENSLVNFRRTRDEIAALRAGPPPQSAAT